MRQKKINKPSIDRIVTRRPKLSRNVEIQKKLTYTQNFIKSSSLIAQIIQRHTNLSKFDKVLEIGTGSGKITKALAPRVQSVVTVEKDKLLIEKIKLKLAEYQNINFIYKDFLEFNLVKLGDYKVFSNIPFALTSKIIKKLLFSSNPPLETYLIMQKEAFDRLIGKDEDFTVFLPAKLLPFYDMSVIHRFDKEDFSPPPRVKCIMAKIIKYKNHLIDEREKKEYWDFIDFLSVNYKGTIKSSLEKILTPTQLMYFAKNNDFLFMDPIQRINVATFVEIFRFIKDGNASDNKLLNFKKYRQVKRIKNA
jgi:23S rRNA (adenine-N6)-dimethyltransferase